MSASVTRQHASSQGATETDPLRPLLAAVVAGVFLVDGLLRTAYFYLGDLAEGGRPPLRAPLINEMTGSAAVVIVFFLIVLPASRRFPLFGPGWVRRLPLHLLAFLAFSVAKTLLQWGSRAVLRPLLGLGPYDYGDMPVRFLMEGANDVLFYVILAGAVQLWDAWQARHERQLREARLEAALNEARLQALQGQLQPHFLFNTLNAISSVMYADPAQADRLMSRLSDLLRSSLTAPQRPEVGLEEELEILGRYVELMSARFGDRLTVDVSVDPEAHGAVVPVFLLQPLVENAIQHGVASRSGPGRVEVTVERVEDTLHLAVADDGPGVEGDPAHAVGKGVGLRNTRDRLAHLYGDGARITLQNGEPGGLRVLVRLPFRATPMSGGGAS